MNKDLIEVKKKAEELGMSKDDIIKAVKLFNYADMLDVKFHIKDNNGLGMKSNRKIRTMSEDLERAMDKAFAKMDDAFKSFNDIFKRK